MLIPKFKMKYPMLLIVTIISLNPVVSAFWRLLCHGQLGVARIDPIVSFGAISSHAHFATGSGNLGVSSTVEDLMSANCTSCSITQDRSAYWAPALYFQHESNGSFELVPTVGGMTVYYFTDNNATVDEKLAAFPPGFRMVAGNTNLRSYPYTIPYPEMSNWGPEELTQSALAAKSIGFNCLNYTRGYATEGSLEYHYLRNKTFLDDQCSEGVRFEIQFPSCWDGVHLDSPEHNTHILYPPQLKTGPCPEGFNVRTPVMFYETIWLTNLFVNFPGKFVIANGDTEGYGYHADFIAGWNQTFLQQAVDQCTNSSGLQTDCPLFNLQPDEVSTSCKFTLPTALQDEDYAGPLQALPGNVPIQNGPANATKLPSTPLGGPLSMPGGFGYGGSSSNAVNTNLFTISMNTDTAIATLASNLSTTPVMSPYPRLTSATGDVQLVSTTTFISDGQDIVVLVYEEIVTVTAATTITTTTVPRNHRAHKHERVHYYE